MEWQKTSQPSPLFPTGKVPLDRRSFLKTSVLATAGFTFARLPVMAGPLRGKISPTRSRQQEIKPRWVKRSLTERGERTVYRGAELEEDWNAHWRHLRGSTLPWRRRQALALGHLQSAHRHRLRALRQAADALGAARAGLRAAGYRRRDGNRDVGAGPTHWREVSFTGEYPSATSSTEMPCVSSDGKAGGIFAVHSAQCRGFPGLPATVMEFRREKHVVRRRAFEVELAWLAGERRKTANSVGRGPARDAIAWRATAGSWRGGIQRNGRRPIEHRRSRGRRVHIWIKRRPSSAAGCAWDWHPGRWHYSRRKRATARAGRHWPI